MALKTSMQLADEQQCWDAYEFAIEHGANVVSSSFAEGTAPRAASRAATRASYPWSLGR